MTLDYCSPNRSYVVENITGTAETCRHLYNLGITEGSLLTCVFTAPSGDPIAFDVQGTLIAFRKQQLKQIIVKPEAM